MNDTIKIPLDRYESGIIMNALILYKNKMIEERVSTDAIDELIIKFHDRFIKHCPLLKNIKGEYAR